jgi:hypothetical protein
MSQIESILSHSRQKQRLRKVWLKNHPERPKMKLIERLVAHIGRLFGAFVGGYLEAKREWGF